jgi:hypothetical protein
MFDNDVESVTEGEEVSVTPENRRAASLEVVARGGLPAMVVEAGWVEAGWVDDAGERLSVDKLLADESFVKGIGSRLA